jgi:uncharacterized membrane protein YtjA (UPF0391 family)
MNEETGRPRRRWWTWLGAVLMVLPCPMWLVFAALGIGGLGGGAATHGNSVLSTVFIVISVVGLLLTAWRAGIYLWRRQHRTST